MEKRILITGVGRRIELMQAFRQAAQNLGITLKLIGADMAGTAPALAYCDYYRNVCAMREPSYISELLTICKEEKIDLLMPTIDTDLQVLSDNADKFMQIGTKVLISAPDKIAICRDKNFTSDFFIECGLKAPKPYNDYREYDGPYPCFIKPKDGSSSINAFKVNSAEELPGYAERVGDYIIQPFVDGVEYTADIFCDFDGNPIYITPRIRLAVRSGEVLKTQIVEDEKIISECRALIEKYKPCGPITVQLIRDKVTGEDYYIEINPRYGGGAPLSMKAGARSAEALLKLLMGEKLSYTQNMEDGAIYSRFDQSVCITPGNAGQKVKGVIFDLDDTLYPEKEYVKSGYEAVGKYLAENVDASYADSAAQKLWSYFMLKKAAIDEMAKEICSSKTDLDMDALKQAMLNVYREHMPNIKLYDGVMALIDSLKKQGVKIGIITDGRPEGQRNKLEALGLNSLVDDIVVTDELGGISFRKPCDIAYRIMQTKWHIPYEQMLYVGDNPNKDFIAPKQLGMQSVYVWNKDGIYYSESRVDSGIKKIESVVDLLDAINL